MLPDPLRTVANMVIDGGLIIPEKFAPHLNAY